MAIKKKAGKKASKKAPGKTPGKNSKKPAKKTAKKASPKAAKKTPAKKAAGKPAKKAGGKPVSAPRPAARKPEVQYKILNVVPSQPAPAPAVQDAGTRLREGQQAPDFSLTSDGGSQVSLRDYRGQYVILYFYPKDDTPGCTQEACDLRDSYGNLRNLKAAVLGVSKDSVESHQKFKAKYNLPFPLLADVDGRVCEAYDVWKEKSMYGKTFMGIERTTFVIDPEGRIRRIFPKVKVQGHVAEILAAIR